MIQILIQGLLLSGLYALIAMGFMLVFSIGRTLSLAYGAYLLIGGYVYFWISQQLDLPKVIGIIGAIGVGMTMGLLKHQLIVKTLRGNQVAIEISTLILAVVLQAAIVLVFGDSSKILLPIVSGVVTFGGVQVTFNILVAMLISWLVIAMLYVFVRTTHVGRAMQAVSMDEKGAAISGIDPDKINLITWSISGGLGALGGVFFASYTQLYPGMWVAPLIISVAVVIVGGIGSIIGTLIVAHIIGFLEIIVVSVWAPELRGVVTMLLIIGVLLLRPQGLFGREEIH